MSAILAIRRGDSWEEIPIHSGRFCIGRDQSNDFAVETAHVSRNHCEIFFEAGVWYVRDLGSKLGTQINGSNVTKSALVDGDVLTLGNKLEATFRTQLQAADQETVMIGIPQAKPEPSGMRLVAINGPIANQVFRIEEEITRLGRHASCHICIPLDTVSQFHAEIIRAPEGLVVADLNSSNGSYINDRRIHRQTLEPGDKLRIDAVTFRFEDKNYSVSKMGTRIRGDLLKELTVDGDDRSSQQYPEFQPQANFDEKVLVRGLNSEPSAIAQSARGNGWVLWLVVFLLLFGGSCFGVWYFYSDQILGMIQSL